MKTEKSELEKKINTITQQGLRVEFSKTMVSVFVTGTNVWFYANTFDGVYEKGVSLGWIKEMA